MSLFFTSFAFQMNKGRSKGRRQIQLRSKSCSFVFCTIVYDFESQLEMCPETFLPETFSNFEATAFFFLKMSLSKSDLFDAPTPTTDRLVKSVHINRTVAREIPCVIIYGGIRTPAEKVLLRKNLNENNGEISTSLKGARQEHEYLQTTTNAGVSLRIVFPAMSICMYDWNDSSGFPVGTTRRSISED
ncbi:unnamed protein product [Allacma fusca]|uniref:Uncharacterized protein n=1 Tax=Allacma fusca TaxID=39272 RepID=A0A8J2LUQ0_9HEXA|nr:unnamed protein product [Allacma fusca]